MNDELQNRSVEVWLRGASAPRVSTFRSYWDAVNYVMESMHELDVVRIVAKDAEGAVRSEWMFHG